MNIPQPLPPERLRAVTDPDLLPHDTTDDYPPGPPPPPRQPRALAAMELSLSIPGCEYNVFLAGYPGQGRTHFALDFLVPRAAKLPVPPDLVYAHDFDDPDRPRLLTLPPGQGRPFRSAMAEAVSSLGQAISARLEQQDCLECRQELEGRLRLDRDRVHALMEDHARDRGFVLRLDEDGGLNPVPLRRGRRAVPISPEEQQGLDPDEQRRLAHARDEVLQALSAPLRRLHAEEHAVRERLAALEGEAAAEVLDDTLGPLAERFGHIPGVNEHLAAVRKDALANLEALLPGEDAQPQGGEPGHGDPSARWEVNLFVDNSSTRGAPVVVCEHPTHHNLLGCIERESELGALYTDFSLIRAGDLHRANHGFLILRADEVLAHPQAWEGLLRTLRTGVSRVEDPTDGETARTRTVQPEGVPLQVRIVLVGTDEVFEGLLAGDSRFAKFFKIKAHLAETMPRSPETVTEYAAHLASMARAENLVPLDRTALAGLVDYGSRLARDQDRLALEYPRLRELMIEAGALARRQGRAVVDADLLEEARRARDFRANLYEEEFLNEYDREIIRVSTRGRAVGRVNGLSVTACGDYVLGLPHQIAATVGAGAEGIIDLEREAELGGPIHTKAMMILVTYLLGRFARDKPLILSGSLCFEQSYAEVEGDSASGAELAALLSALSDTPLDLSYAFTGAVNSSGRITAVGEVSRKVEGFFEVCRRRGLTGAQGVLIPADNAANLMLRPEVVKACARGEFAVHAVTTIEEAMAILSGAPDTASLFAAADARLAELTDIARRYRNIHGGGL